MHRATSLGNLLHASAAVTAGWCAGRRPVRDWTWDFEVSNVFARRQLARALAMPRVADARALLDSLEFHSPCALAVQRAASDLPGVRGAWHRPANAEPDRTLLYCHGGGYAFFTRGYGAMIDHVACAARAETFSLDYRLAPEHTHPAQLVDALGAYQALQDAGHAAGRIVVAGDSAGGHLALSLASALRDGGLPQPALVVGLCPWTELGGASAQLHANDRYDWVQGDMTRQFERWFIGQPGDAPEAASPMSFDLVGFPPLYLQAGEREALLDMIRRFAQRAAACGEEVVLDVWAGMTHDFQAWGDLLAQSRSALARFGEAVDHYLGAARGAPLAAAAQTVVRSCRSGPPRAVGHPHAR
jgi:acetyl esterase/lipase